MAQAVAYECDDCGCLTKDIFTVTIESNKHNFTYKEQAVQPRITLSLCKDCLAHVGRTISDALLG